MKDSAQLLIVSGLLMSITIIAESSTMTHSVNTSSHQGERHDLTPILSSIEQSFPLTLDFEVDNAAEGVELSTSFDNVSDSFESRLISRGYSSSFILTSASETEGTHTFVYSFMISDGIISVELDQTATF